MQRLQLLKDTFFGLDVAQQQLIIGCAVAAAVAGGILTYAMQRRSKMRTIPVGEGWWGEGEKPLLEDQKIYPFTVETSDEEIEDLHERIDKTRFTDPLEDSGFQYGFNSTYLKKVVSYWRNTFDWKKQVAMLNKYPHFKTKIEGLDVHFIHVRPLQRGDERALPLMLVHGWPGSFYEFYKILPLLTQNHNGFTFEVVIPSIPGYGFSEAPHKKGFNSLAAARIFLTLMERLGFSQFYLQGGDWGSLITTNMAQMRPDCVKGLHLNMCMSNRGFKVLLSIIIGPYLPFLVGFSQEDVRRLFPFFQKNVWQMLEESGYLHIQATKPDTAGRGLNDSPVGLAAYILEKFSSWTHMKNRDLEDGGLERKFSLDDLLTNVMIYWTTGSIISSMRFYKENFSSNPNNRIDAKTGIFVPTGLAAFPQEILHCPKSWAQIRYQNIVSYTFMPEGGHFPALEEPRLLANDVIQFAKAIENL
ncbi:epoxide hydrolase 1-like [Xiphophorus maculatus]|uniref:Epoxide hydrolase n=1 Tax=Xiphophorus maculatus TaxID=8083 RepID=M3ZVL3_XIPMA|nr:epoxide hydrolase 1-like [Xiphophorus maculatus]XP_023183741.1 epoxide hydrolase 1-like [Xiphophorus maculatus]XP_023183742.1 epoxide hydrolase 1-like [Xiphophorus maculatus]